MARTIAGEGQRPRPSTGATIFNVIFVGALLTMAVIAALSIGPDILVSYGLVSPETMASWLHIEPKTAPPAAPASNVGANVGAQPRGAAPADAPPIQYRAAPAAAQDAPPAAQESAPASGKTTEGAQGDKIAAPGGAVEIKQAEEGATAPVSVEPVQQSQEAPAHVEAPAGKASDCGGAACEVSGGARP